MPFRKGRADTSQGKLTREISAELRKGERNDSAIAGDEIWKNVGRRCGMHCENGADYRAGSAGGRLRCGCFRDERRDEPADRSREPRGSRRERARSGRTGGVANAACRGAEEFGSRRQCPPIDRRRNGRSLFRREETV